KRAVPLFLIGGGLFTLFTLGALGMVGVTAIIHPQWAFLTEGIVNRLEANGVVEQVIQVREDISAIGTLLMFQLFFHSMSSAMLGFSGYEVIPASGKHAARPKWKVINTALTLAAVFLIGTGVVQLYAAKLWNIPATEGYSTLLIEYEIGAVQVFGEGIEPKDIIVTNNDRQAAANLYNSIPAARASEELFGETESHLASERDRLSESEFINTVAYDIAISRAIKSAIAGTTGQTFLTVAGLLLAIILLLAQGGGYVGGAAVAANAARLGRLPHFFTDDRIGIAVIWAISAVLIPIIRQVVVVEAYYAFGFVSAFVITSTTVFFVRDDILRQRGITPGSPEARSLHFAGLRGMIASYFMAAVLVTQKTEALGVIILAGAAITLYQIYIANGGFKRVSVMNEVPPVPHTGDHKPRFEMGIQRAHDYARQRGVVDALDDLIESNTLAQFDVGPERLRILVAYLYNIDHALFNHYEEHEDYERIEEPNIKLEETYQLAYSQREEIVKQIEHYSRFGIFMFIRNYHVNWVAPEYGRDAADVQQAMVDVLFPQEDHDTIWAGYCAFQPTRQPEPIWQFCRRRYLWAKAQWPNLSGRITTIWTLQDFDLIPKNIDVRMVITVADGKQFRHVKVHSGDNNDNQSEQVSAR
ncbi:MAG: hypothetical protein KDJ52_12665, partial [Anaerolineae bacterium]|nr:hypothetical protein [Anaerolineae bacterium]